MVVMVVVVDPHLSPRTECSHIIYSGEHKISAIEGCARRLGAVYYIILYYIILYIVL